MKICQNIYQTSGIMYGTCSNTYVIKTSEGLLQFDAGTGERQYQCMKQVQQKWNLPQEIKHVFLTHTHFDHAGNAYHFQQEGAKIWIGKKDFEDMTNGGQACLEEEFGMPFPRTTADEIVQDQNEFHFGDVTVHVIAAPGHTRGSVVYLVIMGDGQRVMITGDQFSVSVTAPDPSCAYQVLPGWTGGPGFAWTDYLSTVEKLSHIRADLILTGHWAVLFDNSKKVLQALVVEANKAFLEHNRENG